MVADTARKSALVVVPALMRLGFKSVVDVGCGPGAWLKVFNEQGVSWADMLGIDFLPASWLSENIKQMPWQRFYTHDLNESLRDSDLGHFDLAVCVEVAEHLKPERGPSLIDDLALLSDTIFFGAATPGQGGTGHINERPHSYWSAMLEKHGYRQIWRCARDLEQTVVSPWYWKNAVLWTRRDDLVWQDVPIPSLHRPKPVLRKLGPRADTVAERQQTRERRTYLMDALKAGVVAVCYINGDGDLLPEWFDYYQRLGVTEFLFWVHGPQSENEVLHDLLPNYPARILGTHMGYFSSQSQFVGTRACVDVAPERWVLIVDSDEWVELPCLSLAQTVEAMVGTWLNRIGGTALSAPFAQRIREDGLLVGHDPALGTVHEEYPMWAQRLREQFLQHWRVDKHPLFFNGEEAQFVDPGHHTAPIGSIVSELKGTTHHFRWRRQLLERMKRATEGPYQWRALASKKILEYLDKHGGRLSLDGAIRYSRDRWWQALR